MHDRGQPGLGAGVDVDGTANDAGRDRNAADQSRRDIGHPLGDQLTAGGRDALPAVELVRRFEIQQRVERSDHGDRQAAHVNGRIRPVRKIGPRQKAEKTAQRFGHGHLNQVAGRNLPQSAQLLEQQAEHHSQQHHRQRRGNDRALQPLRAVPQHQHHDRYQANRGGAQVHVAQQPEFRKRIVIVRLQELHFAFRIGVVSDEMRKLLENQDHADRGQQSLDHARGNERRDEPHSGDAEQNLDHPADDQGQQKGLERAELRNLRNHDRRNARRRSADAHLRTAQQPDDHAADHARHDSRDQRRARGQRHAEAQRQRHQKDHEPRRQIARDRRRRENPRGIHAALLRLKECHPSGTQYNLRRRLWSDSAGKRSRFGIFPPYNGPMSEGPAKFRWPHWILFLILGVSSGCAAYCGMVILGIPFSLLIVAIFAVVIGASSLLTWTVTRRQRPAQFSLRAILIATAVIGSLIGVLVSLPGRSPDADRQDCRDAFIQGRITREVAREVLGDEVDSLVPPIAENPISK